MALGPLVRHWACRRRVSSMRQLRLNALLLCTAGIALSLLLPCCGLEPTAASTPAPASQSAPQPGSAPQTAASAAREALAKLKAAKSDPPYYADFPHGQGVLLDGYGAPCVCVFGLSSLLEPVTVLTRVTSAVQWARRSS